jgi:hypothetical protein
MDNNSEHAMSSKEKSEIEDVKSEKKSKEKELANARVRKHCANLIQEAKMVTNHMTKKRNMRSRRIKAYAKSTGKSIDVIKQEIMDKELLFDTNFNVYKSGEHPPTSDFHICSIDVNKEEYDLIMKLRKTKRKYAEEKFPEIRRENAAQLLAEDASTSENNSKEEVGKPDYDLEVHNEEPGTRVFIKFGNERSNLEKVLLFLKGCCEQIT